MNRIILFCFYLVIYRLGLDWIYENYISVNFVYMGFLNNYDANNGMVSWLLFLVSLPAIYRIYIMPKKDASTIVLLLYLISYVPFTSCICFGLFNSWQYILLNEIFWMILLWGYILISRYKLKRLPIIRVCNYYLHENFVEYIGYGAAVLVIVISGIYTGFRLNFSLFDVYDIRLEARTYSFPVMIAYFLPMSRIILLLALGNSVLRHEFGKTAFFLFAQMLSFGIDGLKSTFFMTFLVLAVTFIPWEHIFKSSSKLILVSFPGITFLSIIECICNQESYIALFFIRREMYVTNFLGYLYYDFFSINTPDYFRSSFLRIFGFDSPYAYEGIGRIIGRLYFNSNTMNCNNGLISDAITNFGPIGVLILPIILIFVLRLYDRCTVGLDIKFTIIFSLHFTRCIVDSFLLTGLLTHGLLVAMYIMYLLSAEKDCSVLQKSNFQGDFRMKGIC